MVLENLFDSLYQRECYSAIPRTMLTVTSFVIDVCPTFNGQNSASDYECTLLSAAFDSQRTMETGSYPSYTVRGALQNYR